ncbi:MAG: NifB/NifX family molybdenum-iron cluster-binding protein, partial [Anaerolineales bacterium]|nr:NifB/NifX family molybdenum-iron cluster-binding protein [Anaerolineales bacterium]
MRIAISCETNNGLQSQVAAHFGRCPYFVLVDIQEDSPASVQVVENPFFNNHSPGQVPGFIQSQEANVMLAGGMGQRAVMFFNQMGIQTATGAHGTVKDAVHAFLNGELS